jgi:sorbitol-6-phosphate 2-dehydrogenase
MSDWLGLTGKSAIVTGGAVGIGRAVAQSLAAVGVHVVVADFNAAEGERTVADLAATTGTRPLFQRCDVTKRDEVDATVAAAITAYGRVDILVANAGILIPRLLVDPDGREELTEEIWDKVVAVNLKGTFLFAQAVARTMLADGQGGAILIMTSESGSEGSEGQSVYAATKAAGYNLARSWAKELGRHGIRVVGVAPGIMEATALRNPEYERAVAYTRGLTVDQLRENYTKVSSIPLRREGRLSEVGDLICFLASHRASYIHGTTVNISGGKSRA